MTTLSVTVRDTPAGQIIVLDGQADITNFRLLAEGLFGHMPLGRKKLIVDAAKLAYMDSMALRSLAQAARVLKQRGGHLTLLNPQLAVLKLLELVGADTYMVIQQQPG